MTRSKLVFKLTILEAIVVCCLQFPLIAVASSVVYSHLICLLLSFVIESREAAYLYAITSAMAMYTITRNCAKSKIDNCGCGPKPRDGSDGFEWGRCTEDVNFGYQKSKAFVDAAETRIDGHYSALAKMNLHNNEAGRSVSNCAHWRILRLALLLGNQ